MDSNKYEVGSKIILSYVCSFGKKDLRPFTWFKVK